jgi:dGTPase
MSFDEEDNLLIRQYAKSAPDDSAHPVSVDNPRDREFLTMLRNEREAGLSPYAFKSQSSRGRLEPEEPCMIRSPFERDTGRIIYSQAFRRLRHKTQVFFNPQNDHICSRIEHVIYVNYIATTIARALNLNLDLVQPIALGHDIGHAPFGHSGERILDECIKRHRPDCSFSHESQSLRVADVLAGRNVGHKGGLNLSFEVRDGIVSHCGETYGEHRISPDREKSTESILENDIAGIRKPATLEGCVVRIADKIAYVGRDIEDAARAGILEFEDLPPAITSRLGNTNAQIINTLVADIVHNSLNRDEIRLSDDAGEALELLLRENVRRIYSSEKIMRYEQTVKNTVEALFDALLSAVLDSNRSVLRGNPVYVGLAEYARGYPEESADPVQIVTDYIAGMTDSFATRCFEQIYWL